MKIAIPTKGNVVDDHFGHCEAYTLFSIGSNSEIENTELLPSPQGCGCKSDIAGILKEKGVNIMLAGNMGNGALNVLKRYGIEVCRGCSGNINDVVKGYLQGYVTDSGEGCEHHHEEGHQCNH